MLRSRYSPLSAWLLSRAAETCQGCTLEVCTSLLIGINLRQVLQSPRPIVLILDARTGSWQVGKGEHKQTRSNKPCPRSSGSWASSKPP